ncbi:hypothetical protein AB0I52_10950 [Streptomyces sp. NPDC050423]|uniref:hypothetical protein n=1 Tax=Streptomyces sp. NPDC050423 TaxID=3155402 RepID=UPI003447721C
MLNGLVISVFMVCAACLLLGLRVPVRVLPGLAAVVLAAAVGCATFGLAPAHAAEAARELSVAGRTYG